MIPVIAIKRSQYELYLILLLNSLFATALLGLPAAKWLIPCVQLPIMACAVNRWWQHAVVALRAGPEKLWYLEHRNKGELLCQLEPQSRLYGQLDILVFKAINSRHRYRLLLLPGSLNHADRQRLNRLLYHSWVS